MRICEPNVVLETKEFISEEGRAFKYLQMEVTGIGNSPWYQRQKYKATLSGSSQDVWIEKWRKFVHNDMVIAQMLKIQAERLEQAKELLQDHMSESKGEFVLNDNPPY